MASSVAAEMAIALEYRCSSLNGDTKTLWQAEMTSTLGLCQLSQHNFRHNRLAKALSIMPA